jgi:AcrR family transcriptional regulator
MKGSGSDRRVKYTKTVLKDALVHLMQSQHISSISIKTLCEIADINRSTFYTHYTDQYDLLRHIEEDVMANLKLHLEKQEYADDLPVTVQAMTRILEYAKENAALFDVLLSGNCDFAFQKDVLELSEIVSWKYNKTMDVRTMEYLQAYATTGCISLLHKWLKDGMVESVPTITELILKVLYRGIIDFQ